MVNIKQCKDDKTFVDAPKNGEVVMPFVHVEIRLKHVLLIAVIGYNLVSVNRLAEKGIPSLFRSENV